MRCRKKRWFKKCIYSKRLVGPVGKKSLHLAYGLSKSLNCIKSNTPTCVRFPVRTNLLQILGRRCEQSDIINLWVAASSLTHSVPPTKMGSENNKMLGSMYMYNCVKQTWPQRWPPHIITQLNVFYLYEKPPRLLWHATNEITLAKTEEKKYKTSLILKQNKLRSVVEMSTMLNTFDNTPPLGTWSVVVIRYVTKLKCALFICIVKWSTGYSPSTQKVSGLRASSFIIRKYMKTSLNAVKLELCVLLQKLLASAYVLAL